VNSIIVLAKTELSANLPAMWWYALLFWFVLMVLAIGNGTVSIKLIIPYTGLTAGLAISTFLRCVLIPLATWMSIRWLAPHDATQASGIGQLWLVMTLGPNSAWATS
jgi:antibiotic biosynthesis monooxygenase (ABM) superfamily enzyme